MEDIDTPEPYVQPPMSKEDLRKLAADIHESKVFGTWMMGPEPDPSLVGMVFMPLILGASLPTNVAHAYEYMNVAGPRAINGYPNFFSCRILVKEDIDELKLLLDLLDKQKREFMKGDDNGDTSERTQTGGAQGNREEPIPCGEHKREHGQDQSCTVSDRTSCEV